MHGKVNIKQLLYLIIGLTILFASTFIENEIAKEILLIGSWVTIWETVDLAIFSEPEERKYINVLKALLKAEIITK